jgi:catalase
MHGYSGHTYKFVREDGEWVYVQIHLRVDGGFKVIPWCFAAETKRLNLIVQTLDNETAVRLSGESPDYGVQALFEAIENKRYPSWTVYVVRVYHLSLPSRDSVTCHSKR